MAKRHKMSYGKSKKYFSKTASPNHVHRKNGLSSNVPSMRGGIRL